MAITLTREAVPQAQLLRLAPDESVEMARVEVTETIDLTRDEMQSITLVREEV